MASASIKIDIDAPSSWPMKTVRIMMDESLIAAVDQAVLKLRTTRSAFVRQAIRAQLDRLVEQEKEWRHVDGYRRQRVRRHEFAMWEREQIWPKK